jgi:ADYC domain
LALAFLLLSGTAVAGSSIRADGGQFKVTFADGRVLTSRELVGTELEAAIAGRNVRLRIDKVESDPVAPDILLHEFSVRQPDGRWKNLCRGDSAGRSAGFPLPGKSRANGTLDTSDPSAFEIACTSGAQAKCARYGYLPWGAAPDGTPLLLAFNACVLMLRADYAGDNAPTTRDGAKIDIGDRWNIQSLDADDNKFEAGWDAAGAVCVHHPRIGENMTLEKLEAGIPRLKGRTGPACTPELAKQLGALIFNRSRR